MVVCLERGADLHTAQLMPLPLTVSCFSKIQIGFTFLAPAHPGSPGQRAVKRVCVCVCVCACVCVPAGHGDQQRQSCSSNGATARRSAAITGSVMLTAELTKLTSDSL